MPHKLLKKLVHCSGAAARSAAVKAIHLIGGLLSAAIVCVVNAQTSEDVALLKKVSDATKTAPASRITHTVTDRDSGAVLESTVVERVLPDGMHFLTMHHGSFMTK
jgi:hypothetical protein